MAETSGQIKQERAEKISSIRKSVDAEFKTSLENRIDKINAEKETWISAGIEAEATELAQKRIFKAREDAADIDNMQIGKPSRMTCRDWWLVAGSRYQLLFGQAQ